MRTGWSRASVLFAVAGGLFVLVNAGNAIHKGGDAKVFFEGGRRLLDGEPLYTGSGPASGFIGPPFQALFFAPFAALARVTARGAALAWYAVNLLALGCAVWWWARAVRWRGGAASERAVIWTWPALLAVLFPLQTNFEHQNMNTLLLALVGATMVSILARRDAAAGALLGTAAALKVFPALLIVYLATAGFGRVALAALGTAGLLTLLPAAIYGPAGYAALCREWLAVSSGGWPVRGQNQSLIAAADRLLGGDAGASGVHTMQDAPGAVVLYAIAAIILSVCAAAAFVRRRDRSLVAARAAGVLVLAVLLSPIAWDHYWTLMFPGFLVGYDALKHHRLGSRWWIAFWTAALLTSGLSRVTVGASGLAIARQWSANTLGALLLFATLAALSIRRGDESEA